MIVITIQYSSAYWYSDYQIAWAKLLAGSVSSGCKTSGDLHHFVATFSSNAVIPPIVMHELPPGAVVEIRGLVAPQEVDDFHELVAGWEETRKDIAIIKQVLAGQNHTK